MAGRAPGGDSVNPQKTSYTIVAVPSQDDPVWKYSSEKVPHLTLLFLGDQLEEANDVARYLKHAVDTTLQCFWLDVARRGVLGDKQADVLYFTKNSTRNMADFRQYLLADPRIKKAYESIEQFPQWTPHLTMGYPTSPAKPDDRDYPGFQTVKFDRIDMWTDNYEGVEFPLKTYDDEELSMAEKGQSYLRQYGVKGMHWGIRRANPDATSAANDAKLAVVKEKQRRSTVSDKLRRDKLIDVRTSQDAKRAKFVKTKASVSGVHALSNQDLQSLITRMNLERQYKDLKRADQNDTFVGAGSKWAGNFVNDVLKDAAASWLKRPGSNFSGRTSGTAYSWGQQVAGSIGGNQRRAIGS